MSCRNTTHTIGVSARIMYKLHCVDEIASKMLRMRLRASFSGTVPKFATGVVVFVPSIVGDAADNEPDSVGGPSSVFVGSRSDELRRTVEVALRLGVGVGGGVIVGLVVALPREIVLLIRLTIPLLVPGSEAVEVLEGFRVNRDGVAEWVGLSLLESLNDCVPVASLDLGDNDMVRVAVQHSVAAVAVGSSVRVVVYFFDTVLVMVAVAVRVPPLTVRTLVKVHVSVTLANP